MTDPLQKSLVGYRIVLASASPRRQQFFKEMGCEFEVRIQAVEEIYPPVLQGSEIACFLSKLKATPFEGTLDPNDILITSDTVVWHKDNSLAKADNEEEAYEMLTTLSGEWHEVITAVTFTTTIAQKTVYDTTRVRFKKLSEAEIRYYIKTFKPFDKAGAYGIQEWIGLIGIEEIHGSYTNVVGLPTRLVYETLMSMPS